jgi:hypothetical protein
VVGESYLTEYRYVPTNIIPSYKELLQVYIQVVLHCISNEMNLRYCGVSSAMQCASTAVKPFVALVLTVSVQLSAVAVQYS